MAVIKLSELHPVGAELFQDSESFLNELNEQEIATTGGGDTVASVISQASVSVGISIASLSVITQASLNF